MDDTTLDIAANRRARKYSRREQAQRVCWAFGSLLIRWSARPMFGWRRAVLRAFGASVGAEAKIYPSTRVYMPWNLELGGWSAIGEDALIYNLGKVTIGAKATVSYRAHICAGTHDFSDPTLPLLKVPVRIDQGAWVGTDAFIGPGVHIAEGALVGARAVVIKDVARNEIVAGNPAKCIGMRGGAPRTAT